MTLHSGSAWLGVLAGMGLLSLGRDHRLSETLTSLFILGVAGVSGWLTFYAPPGTLHRYVPFVPPTVTPHNLVWKAHREGPGRRATEAEARWERLVKGPA